jgi:hypothetical protein
MAALVGHTTLPCGLEPVPVHVDDQGRVVVGPQLTTRA